MPNLFATPMLANDSLPSVNYLTCNEPSAVVPIVGTQDLYAWADTPVGVQVRVIYQS